VLEEIDVFGGYQPTLFGGLREQAKPSRLSVIIEGFDDGGWHFEYRQIVHADIEVFRCGGIGALSKPHRGSAVARTRKPIEDEDLNCRWKFRSDIQLDLLHERQAPRFLGAQVPGVHMYKRLRSPAKSLTDY
jgi:hypothetical protein